MVTALQGTWTMNVALLNRKRSRLALESDDEGQRSYQEQERERESMPALRRTKTQCELDDLDVVAPEDAWEVDVEGILASPTLPTSPGAGNRQPHSNVERYRVGESLMVFCVQGNVHLHYELLW